MLAALHKEVERLEEAAKYGSCEFRDLRSGDVFCANRVTWMRSGSGSGAVKLADGIYSSLFHSDEPVTRLRRSEVIL